MKKILRWVGAFIGVAVLGFLGGFVLQWTKVSEANQARTTCENALGDQSKRMEVQDGLLSLYRARHEAGRNNFGLVGEQLLQAKKHLATAGVTGEGVSEIERATTLAAANDAASIEPIQNAIAAIESK